MNTFKFLVNITILITFSSSSLFANSDAERFYNEYKEYQQYQESKEKNSETLEDEVSPEPIPALIDLTDRKKQNNKSSKYGRVGLLLFNIAIFTAGMALVKTIDGKNV
jgi:hypothetical protein